MTPKSQIFMGGEKEDKRRRQKPIYLQSNWRQDGWRRKEEEEEEEEETVIIWFPTRVKGGRQRNVFVGGA